MNKNRFPREAHTMLDTRTNELTTEQVTVYRLNFMFLFGLGWY